MYPDTYSIRKVGKQLFYFTGNIHLLKVRLFFFFAYFFTFFSFFFLLLNWNETKFLNFILNVFIGCGERNEKSSAQDWPTANDPSWCRRDEMSLSQADSPLPTLSAVTSVLLATLHH